MRAALLAVILGFVPGLLDPFNAPKAAVLRLIGLPLLVWAAMSGIARTRGDGSTRAARVLDLAVLGWLAAAILSTLFGLSPRLSLFGEIQQREGLLTVLALCGLYFAARRSHRDAAHAQGTLHVMLAGAGLAAAYALLQRAGLDPVEWAHAAFYPVTGGEVLRVFGSLGNAILLGAVLATAFAMGLSALMSPRRAGVWTLALLMLTGAAVAGTLSRGAFVALFAGTAVALLVSLRTWGPAALRRAWPAVVTVCGAILAWGLFALRAPIGARIAETWSAHSESTPARLEIATSALAMWTQHPWTGVGPDAFGLAFPAVQTPDLWQNGWIGIPVHAHSVPLQLMATGGIATAVFAGLWLVALALALWPASAPAADDGRARVRTGLLSGLAALATAGAFNPVGLAGASIFVVFSALAANVAGAAPSVQAPERGRSTRTRTVAVTAAALAALAVATPISREVPALGAANQAHAFLTTMDLAPEGQRAGVTASAVRWSARATHIAPAEDEFWRLRTDALLAACAWTPAGVSRDSLAADALASASRAMALEPGRASNHQRLANALSACGRWASADSAFASASRLAPFDALILMDRYRSELHRGRADLALESARRIVALYPRNAAGHAVVAGAMLKLGRPAEARAALTTALEARWEAGTEAEHAAARSFLRALDAGSLRPSAAADSVPPVTAPLLPPTP